jgi:TolA-binding protein
MRIKGIHMQAMAAALLALAAASPSALFAQMTHAEREMARDRTEIRNSGGMAFEPLEKKPKRKETGFFFHHASKVPPNEQFAAAAALEDSGKRSEACDAYDRLVRSFPYSAAASQAQLRLGRLLEKRGKYKKAYEEYLYMLYFYPENAPADSLLRQMYAIANYYRTKGKESRALDYFERLAQIAPQWKHTPEVLLQVGAVHFQNKDYYDAAEAFDTVTSNHPGTPEALAALAQHALVLHALSLKYPRDEAIMIRTIAVTTAALRDCPVDIPERPALVANLDDVRLRRSERYFQMAVFYDKKSYAPETRVAAYRDYLRRFPKGPHAEQARARLAVLEKALLSTTNP